MPEIIVKLGDRIIHRYSFDKEMVSVGRARDNDIVIENLSVSRNHARLKKQDGKFILTDMNSANGTLVNGVRISKTEVAHNDEITVGKHTLIFLEQHVSHASVAGITSPTDDNPSAAGVAPASVPSVPTTARVGLLSVLKGKQMGTDFRLNKVESRIGRAGENDIRLHDWYVSKKHAVLMYEGGSYLLRDLDSWRGTTVNGNTIREVELKDGDEIVLGTTTLVFRLVEAGSLPAVQAPPPDEGSWDEKEEDWDDGRRTGDRVPLPTAEPAPSQRAAPALPAAAVNPPSARLAPKGPAHDQEIKHASLEELDQLEAEFDAHIGTDAEEEENRRAAWEMAEMEKAFETGNSGGEFTLDDSEDVLREGEESFCASNIAPADKIVMPSDFDEEEELALYGAAMTDEEPYGQPVIERSGPPSAVAIPKPAPAELPPTTILAPSSGAVALPAGASVSREIAMWEKALSNKSSLIRKNAAKELKKLTGKDYDWTIDPSGN